jgi:hypothetical protein
MASKIILIHPPVSKPAEPPAGIARLAGCLRANDIPHQIIDANLEGILFLLANSARESSATDRWTTRARRHLEANLTALRNIKIYGNHSRYQRAVTDINHLLSAAGKTCNVDLTLADYHDSKLTPVNGGDLIRAAENPNRNPFYPYFSTRILSALKTQPEFVGFSLNYLSQALTTFAMIGFIRKENPGQKIVLGGSLVTSWVKLGTQGLLKNAHPNIFCGLVDEMVAGPGEQKLLELLGVKEGAIDCPPDYSGFPMDRYLSPGAILPYSMGRGCYWHNCAFCPEKAEENPYRPQPIAHVTRDLHALTLQTNPALIHVLDNAISPVQLKALAQNPPGAPWYGFTRVTAHLTDIDFCRSLKQSGCVMLKLGIESGDQNVLDQLNKGIDLATVSAALKTLKQADIATYCYFLFGTPPENEESALRTLDFVVAHCDCIGFLNLAVFNLPAGSMEAQNLTTQDFYAGDLSLYKDFIHPLGWQRAAVRKFLEKTFKKHPAVAAILKRTPDYFTSNHAPFFVLNKV